MSRELVILLTGSYTQRASITVPSDVTNEWLNEHIKSRLAYCNNGDGEIDLEFLGDKDFEFILDDIGVTPECETIFSPPSEMDIRLIENKGTPIGNISYSSSDSCTSTSGESELISNGVFSIDWGDLSE